jgi:sterol desaturase/sphingolipid hydroxylase (fatty acid hydroxylase superfamily)
VAAGATIFFGYIVTSSLLQYAFYYRRGGAEEVKRWKIQPNKASHAGPAVAGPWWLPLPILGYNKPDRAPYHRIFASVNLMVSSAVAAVTTELSVRGQTKMVFDDAASYGWSGLCLDFLLAVLWQSAVEYYWHRLMHARGVYGALHKHHHYYKSPEPFDDMHIHPLEALGYYLILFSPPFVFTCHAYSFVAYMVVMGTCGVLDHCGVHFASPGPAAVRVYDTQDHDLHHALFDVNFGFPFPWFDILHGTYEGNYLGRQYSAKGSIKQS